MTVAENEIHKSIKQNITPVVEDYLKAIYSLRQMGETVRTAALAARLNVKPPTVTAMLKTLAGLNLIRYEPYRGVELTDAGEQIALEVVRHHRLIELYLVEALGFSWDEVHDEAEVLEHFISEKLEARIAAYLGNPTLDPHGDPIPALDGSLPDNSTQSLADLPEKAEARIVRVCDQNADRLRYIAKLGLVPGASVQIIGSAPFDGPVSVQVGEAVHAVDRRLARMILVEK
ncbi:MAG: metal-dependent transcriptional regulator [Acidobacteriota bacterium]|nr:metal-dependent transcriptional regulator [Acidobacteriota bacterium]